MSIQIVEDNPVNARLLALMLQVQGYQTVVARNGKEALTTVSEIPDLQLIITDYMMPEMDGLEFIVKLRALPTFDYVPILITSAHADLETIKRVQGVQCDGFLVKPFDKQELIKRVEHLIRSRPVVLLASRKIMDRLDLGPAEYHDLVKAFAAQLAETIPIVMLEQGASGELISKNLGRLLTELSESASMLGAQQFSQWYSKWMGCGLPARSQCQALMKTLQELERALQANVQSHTNPAA